MRLQCLPPLLLAAVAAAKEVTYNWDITWVRAAPDGFSRPVIGVNNVWPCPTIEAEKGDTIIVKVNNKLGNQTTGIHFHGINQLTTVEMDGPSGVTQCPVPPGSSLTYKFLADEAGSYWYHSHNMGQYPDGLRGPMIIKDPNDPYKGQYDEEVVLTISDWYHEETLTLVRNMLSPSNVNFAPPFPNTLIVNEGLGAKVKMVKGKVYRFRIINMAAFASNMIHFDSHTMEIIMADGSYVQKDKAYQLRISPSQRYDVLITCSERDNRNYPFLISLDINRDFDVAPARWPHNYTGYLMMNDNGPLPADVVDQWRPKDDANLKPLDNPAMFVPVTRSIVLDFEFCRDKNNIPRTCFNGSPYIPQKVPTLYTAATTGTNNTNPAVYGAVHPYVVNSGDVVEIVVNNIDAAIHPFHLHGHQFQVLERPRANRGKWNGRSQGFNKQPPRRDTVHVNAHSYVVIRYKATHPGVFLFHCHIEWHVEMGLTVTMIEAPDKLRTWTFPEDHIDACKKQGIPYKGNAAGNEVDHLSTVGMLTEPDPVYNGAQYTPLPAPRRSRVVRRSV